MRHKITAVRVLHNEQGDRVIGVNKFRSVEPYVLGGAIGGLLFAPHVGSVFFVPSTNIQKIYLECCEDDVAVKQKQKQKPKKRQNEQNDTE